MSFGVRVLEEQRAVGSRHAAYLSALQAAPAGVTFARLEAALARMTADGQVVAAEAKAKGDITTRRTLEQEAAIVAAVQAGQGRARPIADRSEIARVLGAVPDVAKLNAGQRAAVEGLFASQDRYRAVTGFAGVGKTFAFRVAREAAEKEGQALYGLSSMNAHVRELREKAGLPAQTIASWLNETERAMREPGGAGLAAARAKWRGKHLIVDEASTVTNDTGFRLVRAVEALGVGSMTLAGDTGQTGGPGAGNVFKALLDRGVERFEMTTILRQREAAGHLREGVKDLAEGRLKSGMAKLAPHVHAVGKEASDLEIARRAVELWGEKRQAGLGTVLITDTNRMRALQSTLARDVLRAEGVLSGKEVARERLSHQHMTKAEQFRASSYALGDTIVFTEAFKGRGQGRSLGGRATVVGIDGENNLLKLEGRGAPARLDLNREAARGWASFSTYTVGTHEVAAGERLAWEARFKDRGYERGAEFTVVSMSPRSWTIEHADGRKETLSAKDPALSFASHAYAITYERAQGRDFEAPIHTMTSRSGEAVAENKNYVGWSRLTKTGDMVVDDAARVLARLAQNDGRKPVALDHIARTLETAKAEAAKGPETAGRKDPSPQLEIEKGLEAPGAADAAVKGRARTRQASISNDPGGFSL
jgi:ATP-dependent exoDNAse (exonuclease V) alpha subunit